MVGPEGGGEIHLGWGDAEGRPRDTKIGDDLLPGAEALEMIKDFHADRDWNGEGTLIINPSHEQLYEAATSPEGMERWGVAITDTGAWAEVNPEGERSRVPAKTFFVKDGEEGGPEGSKIYWADTVNFKPFPRAAFDALLEDTLGRLGDRTAYETTLATGANPHFARRVNTITDSPSGAAFSQNMFLEPMPGIDASVLADKPPITVITLPHDEDKVKPGDFGFEGLVKEKDPETGEMKAIPDDKPTALIVTDPESGVILVRGFAYHGPQKKGPYTLMNLALPEAGVLPLHASAIEGPDGSVATNLGLSGTGKSTIGAFLDGWKQIGDDEIGVALGGEDGSESTGTFNLEDGVYPIVLGVREDSEPALFQAAFTGRRPEVNRTVFQNVETDENGVVDVHGTRFTENTRVSVPLDYLYNAKESRESDRVPENLIFITKDVGGVLPPIARLEDEQALLWFLMGPTSKTAAQEGDVPEATFSRFFGAPFMSAHPEVYLEKMGDLLIDQAPSVWLVNTGFTGGPDGDGGTRIGIPETKAMVHAALSGELDAAEIGFRRDPRFKLLVPTEIPGSESATALLDPKATWTDKLKYEKRADAFARLFQEYFDEHYGGDPRLTDMREYAPSPIHL